MLRDFSLQLMDADGKDITQKRSQMLSIVQKKKRTLLLGNSFFLFPGIWSMLLNSRTCQRTANLQKSRSWIEIVFAKRSWIFFLITSAIAQHSWGKFILLCFEWGKTLYRTIHTPCRPVVEEKLLQKLQSLNYAELRPEFREQVSPHASHACFITL